LRRSKHVRLNAAFPYHAEPSFLRWEHCLVRVQSCNLCGHVDFLLLIRKDGFDLVRCKQCELVFVANPPEEKELARLYSFDAGYHAKLERDSISTAFHRREADLNLRVLQQHADPGRLLDIGCSTGLFLAAAGKAGWHAQGLEYSADSSQVARDVHGLDVKTGALQAGMYSPGSFDVITMWDVIEHLPDPSNTLKLIPQILKPGGLLVLKTPNVDGLYPRASLRVARRLDFWGHAEPPGHLFQFSASTLQKMASQAGLQTVALHHQRIPISYSFGRVRQWFRSTKWAVYCLAFAPMAWLGPMVGQGDDIALVLRRPT
jgi:2-polyprenyl-3-methyl-5-hydroxy-6-metoxy-1,4-benzoquinol methylase